jgi:hypothetical protein
LKLGCCCSRRCAAVVWFADFVVVVDVVVVVVVVVAVAVAVAVIIVSIFQYAAPKFQ